MATYKVIQDIEAEDHILGPLSLRQFIYALIAAACLYFCYLSLAKHAPYLLVLFLPPAIFTGFFAFPFGRDQPTEVWALAKIRFYFKPRRRIWDQNGMKELVTINVPKKVEVRRTDGLSQNEVRSRLEALANTIDSRGWAVKNADVNLYMSPAFASTQSDTDRLVDSNSMPTAVPSYDVTAADDILDERSNPIAQQFDQMISASTSAHREQLMSMMHSDQSGPTLPAPVDNQSTQTQPDYWFMNQPGPQASAPQAQVVHPGAADPAATPAPATDEDVAQSNALKALKTKDLQQSSATYGHMKTIKPLGSDQAATPPAPAPEPGPKAQELAANNDLNISTLSRVANKKDLPPDEEVVISLH
jgi:hypothetical protein